MKYRLIHVRLNQGGYDILGRYWGLGPKLFAYGAESDPEWSYLRAADREAAKRAILKDRPNARFYR